jgi:ankyrin repeat protein
MKKVINGNPMSKKLHRLSNSYLATILVVALLFGCEPRLHKAVKSRDYDQVAQYLNAGDNIDINSTTEISDFFYGGLRLRYTPLHRAVLCEDIKMIKLLIGRGANLEARDPDRTPLFLAAHYGCVEIVKLLIEHGADPNALDLHTGETPLGRAQLGSYNELIKILIENGGKTRLELKAK